MGKLTELEEVLIGYLETSNARAGVQATAFILLREEPQQMEMCEFLSKNEDATEEEILEQARRIATEEMQDTP